MGEKGTGVNLGKLLGHDWEPIKFLFAYVCLFFFLFLFLFQIGKCKDQVFDFRLGFVNLGRGKRDG